MIRSHLNQEQQSVLEHAYRYRMLFPEFFPGQLAAIESLAQQRILAKAPLYGDRDYYYLTARARRYLGARQFRPGPLSEPDKIRDFAMICICLCDPEAHRTRLTLEDFDTTLGEHRPEQLSRYYVHEPPGESARLGYLRVDRGGRGRWNRLVQRVCRDILDRGQHEACAPHMPPDRLLEFSVVTATQEKAQRLQQAFQEHSVSANVPVQVHVVPELLLLIAPPPLDPEFPISFPREGFDYAPARRSTQ